jgi:hypothetical protein
MQQLQSSRMSPLQTPRSERDVSPLTFPRAQFVNATFLFSVNLLAAMSATVQNDSQLWRSLWREEPSRNLGKHRSVASRVPDGITHCSGDLCAIQQSGYM